jgi:hypothetical protein
VDDFALRRRHCYATITTDAETGRRVAVLPGREKATLESWLHELLGVEIVCRVAGCWATINPPRPGGVHELTTRERWNKVHDLLGQGVGLLDCSHRLGLALNTIKRYARPNWP